LGLCRHPTWQSDVPTLSVQLSGTPIETELATINAGLQRIEAPLEPFDASPYPPAAILQVRNEWMRRMVVEHRSSMVFAQLAQQLFEANATLDTIVVMMRMAQDELRHTATCAEAIVTLGGEARVETDFVVEPLARHGAATAEERALRNVIYTTCLSEMVACARFVATLDHTTDPYLRGMVRRLLADEVLHGQFGFHYLTAWSPWLDGHPDVRRSLERYLVHAFAVLEEELAPKPPFAAPSAAVRALGGADPELAREVFYGTVQGAIVPGLERLGLEAERAWTERQRLA
jgi:hypothetical protein